MTIHYFRFLFCLILFLLLSLPVKALVDYTDDEVPMVPSPAQKMNAVKAQTPRVHSQTSGRGGLIRAFVLGSGVDVIKADYQGAHRKLNRYAFNTHIQTNYNIFLNADFWYAASDSPYLARTVKRQNGNPTGKLGFNWLRFGAPEELAVIDLYAGLMMKSPNSDFASTRNDQLVGVETSKRFVDLAIAFAWELRMTGNPSDVHEKLVGNIHRFSVGLGWRVSEDINLSAEAANYKVAGNKVDTQDSLLSRGFSFSYISPKMNLKLGRWIGLEMGAVFRTNKVSITDDLMQAKLWMLTGLYGNSVYGGLNITI